MSWHNFRLGLMVLIGGTFLSSAKAEGLRLPVHFSEDVPAVGIHLPKSLHIPNVSPGHVSRPEKPIILVKQIPCTRRVNTSVWMNVIRSEALLTAITCNMRDEYNSLMSDRANRLKFASVPVRVLIKNRSHDYTAELANQQSLYDNRTYGDGLCAIRKNIFHDIRDISSYTDAISYIIHADINFGDVCSSEELGLLKRRFS